MTRRRHLQEGKSYLLSTFLSHAITFCSRRCSFFFFVGQLFFINHFRHMFLYKIDLFREDEQKNVC